MVWTQEGSYRLANEWWEKQLAAMKPRDNTAGVDAFAERIVRNKVEQAIAESIQGAERIVDLGVRERMVKGLNEAGERLKTAHEPTQTDRTLSHQSERFLTPEQLRDKKAGTFGDLAAYTRNTIRDSEVLSSTFALF